MPDRGRSAQPWLPGEEAMLSTILSILILIADIWAVINVIQSSESTGTKTLWVVLILVLPVLGLVIWYFAGPKSASG
jgi:Mg2+ and Co2+ transporter CorA